MEKLTERQEEIFNKLKQYIKEHGYSPSVRELGQLMGLKSSETISTHLKKIKAKGYIDYNPKKHRSLIIKVQ